MTSNSKNSMDMRKIYCFDFDGTLTTSDTLLELLKFTFGKRRLWTTIAAFSPLLLGMKIGLLNNGRVKERLFSHFFRGMPEHDFDQLCHDFAIANLRCMRREALQFIQCALEEGVRVLVVSASIDRWIRPFFELLNLQVEILGTQIEVRNGKLTGKFSTPNCYGDEKVVRIRELIDNHSPYQITAFGDSRGDKEMLEYADQQVFKPFR